MKEDTIRLPDDVLAAWKEKIKPGKKKKILRDIEKIGLQLDGLATELICNFFPPNCVLMKELAKAKIFVLTAERLLHESIPVRDALEIKKEVEEKYWSQFRCLDRFSLDEIKGKKCTLPDPEVPKMTEVIDDDEE